MTPKEYREQHPSCTYCIHSNYNIFCNKYTCKVKRKDIFFTGHTAKRCEVYQAEFEDLE